MTIETGSGKIRVLPADVAGCLAAGEVVERPASVVRELLDNSLDAGSSLITVQVVDGGRSRIVVTDDGEGMTPDDAVLAFQRHATSKVRSERDVWALRTLGFRGEALPSIAAVATVRLLTVRRDHAVGTRVTVVGGTVGRAEPSGGAPGTTVEVSDLFRNTPARKKFLKSVATEFSHISQAVQHAALAWPSVHFQLWHNGVQTWDCPAAGSLEDRLLQVYGAKFLEYTVPVASHRTGLGIAGVAIRAVEARGSRAPQELFVNRRAVRNPTVAHAVTDAYGSHLAKGAHPRYALFLEVSPDRVDVNVHPMKREVRFADQDLVHGAVREAVREALTGAGRVGAGTEPAAVAVASVPAAVRPIDSAAGRAASWEPRSFGWATMPDQVPLLNEATVSYDGSVGRAVREVRPLGQISRTFLIAQVEGDLLVVDQHTAHERVLFERLWRAWQRQAIDSQPLLIAEPVDVPASGADLLDKHRAELDRLGVVLEPFGNAAYVVRALPALIGPVDPSALVRDLLEDLGEWRSTASLDARVRPLLASMACQGAVRAGRALELTESRRLIEDWIAEGALMTCPHGRRVALSLPAGELARMFGRA